MLPAIDVIVKVCPSCLGFLEKGEKLPKSAVIIATVANGSDSEGRSPVTGPGQLQAGIGNGKDQDSNKSERSMIERGSRYWSLSFEMSLHGLLNSVVNDFIGSNFGRGFQIGVWPEQRRQSFFVSEGMMSLTESVLKSRILLGCGGQEQFLANPEKNIRFDLADVGRPRYISGVVTRYQTAFAVTGSLFSSHPSLRSLRLNVMGMPCSGPSRFL